MDKYEQLKQKIDEVKTKSLVSGEMKAFITLVLKTCKENKEELALLSEEQIATIKEAVDYVESCNAANLEKFEEVKSDFSAKQEKELKVLNTKIKELNTLIAEVKSIEVKDGKDADEEIIIDRVLSQIKLPEQKEVILDGGHEIKAKLEQLQGEERLDASAIKNLPQVTGRSGGSTARNLFQLHDVSITDVANNDVLKYDSSTDTWVNGTGGGGGGTPGGSDTQVQFNDGGSFGGDSGFTYNKTTDTLTVAGAVSAETFNIEDSDASHYLVIKTTSNLTANRDFTIITGDAARTLTLAGNFTTAGGFNTTLTTIGNSNVTLPTTGTLATLIGIETLSNKTLDEAKIINGGFIKDANNNELIIFTTTTSAVNELTFANAATGNNPTFTASGGDSNIGITLTAKGTGTHNLVGKVLIAPTAASTGSPTLFTLTAPAHTTLTASTEASDVYFNLARTVQFATGALTNQRAIYITAPTYAFVGASTLTTASTVSISGAPVAGTNATITNAYALDVVSGISHVGGVLALANGSAAAPSLYWDVNNTAGFYSSVSGTIQFTASGTARWTINSSNIVSTTTGAQLNRSQGTDGLIFTQQGDTNTGIGMPGSDVLNLITGGVKSIAIDASQNVGVGVFSGSITAGLHLRASTTSSASLRIAAGTPPTSPNEGDLWNDSTQKTLAGYFAGVKQTASTVLFTQTATQTVANTTTQTTVFTTGSGTLTLPANFWVAGKTVTLKVGGVFSTLVTPGNLTVRIKLGSTTIASVVISNLLASASGNAFQGTAEITCRSTGGSGTVMVNGNVNYETGTLVRGVAPLNNGGATTTVDTTASAALDVTVEWATASASNSISATTAIVEVLN